MFNVIEKISDDSFNLNNATYHFLYERFKRNQLVKDYLDDEFKVIAQFVVDKNHPNGNEIHTILDNGLIIIQNFNTKKVITYLIARPGQIRRYWYDLNLKVPSTKEFQDLIELCKEHTEKNWNKW